MTGVLRGRKAEPPDNPAKGKLRRALNTPALTFFGVGMILGAGIYAVIGSAAGEAGGSLWMSFAIASVVALLTGLSYAELTAMYPKAGAEFIFLRKAAPSWPTLALTVALCVALSGLTTATGAVGSLASRNAPTFYEALDRPPWAPPPAVFGPVWTVLYVLMAVSAYTFVSASTSSSPRWPLTLWALQLMINAAWSWLFFELRSGLWAFIDEVVLLAMLVALTVGFWRVRTLAGVLLLPYLVWVGFASTLTLTVWRLNPEILGSELQSTSSDSTLKRSGLSTEWRRDNRRSGASHFRPFKGYPPPSADAAMQEVRLSFGTSGGVR